MRPSGSMLTTCILYRGPTLSPTAPRHPNRHRLRRGDQTKGTLGNLCKSASYSSVQNSEINFRQGSELYLQKKPIRCKTWFIFSHFWPMIVFIFFRLNWMLYYSDFQSACATRVIVSDQWHYLHFWCAPLKNKCWLWESGNGQFNFFRTVAEWWLCQRESCHLEQQAWRQLDLSWWRTSWNLEVNTWHVWGSSQRALLGLSKVRWRVPLMLRGW